LKNRILKIPKDRLFGFRQSQSANFGASRKEEGRTENENTSVSVKAVDVQALMYDLRF